MNTSTAETDVSPATPPPSRLLNGFLAAVALFHIWANTLGTISELRRNALHFALLAAAMLLVDGRQSRRPWGRWFAYLVAGLAVAGGGYLLVFENAFHARNGQASIGDLAAAVVTLVICLELTRRSSGMVIPILAVAVLSYVMWWGRYVPGVFHFRGLSVSRVLSRMYFTEEGVFGLIASISSSYVIMFIIFAAFLLRSGGGDYVIRLANRVAGRLVGGPGLVAVLASGLMGTISGSAVANTASTGAITIPLMKRVGFRPHFAAAVETAASTGGQLMPPVMGAGAFIMAQTTQLPYLAIVSAALLPAVLFYLSVAIYVYLEARRADLRPAAADSTPIGSVLLEGVHFLLPIAVLIGLLIAGFSPTYCAGAGIVAVVVASWLRPNQRMGFAAIVDALALGTQNMMATGLLLVATGIVVGGITMTGASLAFSQMILVWSGGKLFICLVLTALASLFLGMGLPVTAAYVVLSVLAAPSLTGLGVGLLAAHMFIFWMSQDSNVTPPVCLAAFTGAAIAEAPPMRTGLTAWKLAKGLYIIPLLFVYTDLLAPDWASRFEVAAFAALGFVGFAVVGTGFAFTAVPIAPRILVAVSAACLFWPASTPRLLGLGILGGFLVHNHYSSRRQRQVSS